MLNSRKRTSEHMDVSDGEDNPNATESPSTSTSGIENVITKKHKFDQFYKVTIKDNKKVGKCILCENKKLEKIIQMKNSNTSGLKKHLFSYHREAYLTMFPDAEDNKSSKNSKQCKLIEMMTATSLQSKQQTLNAKLIKWLTAKYLPFNFFDDEITRDFFHELNPAFQIPRKDTMRQMAVSYFSEMQEKVKKILQSNKSKISFTIDGWTSVGCKSYYGITAHFIGDDWKLHSLVLDFVPSHGNHTGKNVAKMFFNSLKDYGIENNIQGITVDNTSSNTTFMKELVEVMAANNLHFDCEAQHFRCFAHILNLGAQDALKLLKIESANEDNVDSLSETENEENDEGTNEYEETGTLSKLILLVKKIRKSEQLLLKLKNWCDAAGVKFIKPFLSVSTRWNSAFEMIKTGLELKPALTLLCLNEETVKNILINEQEWVLLQEFYSFLKCFKIASDIFCGENYPTLPMVVVTFNLLIDKIESMIKNLDQKPLRCVIDENLLLSFQSARDKMLKHYNKCNWIYCAALVLDPKHKIYTFSLTKWGAEIKEKSLDIFYDIYNKNYKVNNECKEQLNSLTNTLEQDDAIFEIYALYETIPSSGEAEIQSYLTSSRAPRNENILHWWLVHESAYPTLSVMARDILSIQASSVPCERLFSKASLTIRKQRSCLNSESAKILMCLNSWLSNELLV